MAKSTGFGAAFDDLEADTTPQNEVKTNQNQQKQSNPNGVNDNGYNQTQQLLQMVFLQNHSLGKDSGAKVAVAGFMQGVNDGLGDAISELLVASFDGQNEAANQATDQVINFFQQPRQTLSLQPGK